MSFLYREGFHETNNTKVIAHRYFCADVKEATREVRGKVRTINLCQKKYRKCRI